MPARRAVTATDIASHGNRGSADAAACTKTAVERRSARPIRDFGTICDAGAEAVVDLNEFLPERGQLRPPARDAGRAAAKREGRPGRRGRVPALYRNVSEPPR